MLAGRHRSGDLYHYEFDGCRDLADMRPDGTVWVYFNNGRGFKPGVQRGGGFDFKSIRTVG